MLRAKKALKSYSNNVKKCMKFWRFFEGLQDAPGLVFGCFKPPWFYKTSGVIFELVSELRSRGVWDGPQARFRRNLKGFGFDFGCFWASFWNFLGTSFNVLERVKLRKISDYIYVHFRMVLKWHAVFWWFSHHTIGMVILSALVWRQAPQRRLGPPANRPTQQRRQSDARPTARPKSRGVGGAARPPGRTSPISFLLSY